ncbi:hypothetical protein KI387_024937 [Taxus chinensis]|uniref:Uncharacterized protein n=1 Tax=Taxus chinensis TaxID=29808 RepID=A0AA38LC82_TAXCH|nr:hypothetical protein KI387_024937 [Taxus chinensis]
MPTVVGEGGTSFSTSSNITTAYLLYSTQTLLLLFKDSRGSTLSTTIPIITNMASKIANVAAPMLLFLFALSVGATSTNSYQQDIVVRGTVFCDTNPFSDSTYFLPGALVSVECSINSNRKWKSSHGIVSIQGETDENGEFRVELPVIHNINPTRSCSVRLLSSPHESCDTPSIPASSQLALSSSYSNEDIQTYVCTPLSYRSSTKQQQQTIISSFPRHRALEDSTSKATSSPPPLPTIPQLPKFSLPPLPSIPPLPKLSFPPLPTIPSLNIPNTVAPPLPTLSVPPLPSIPSLPKLSVPPLPSVPTLPKFSVPPLSNAPTLPSLSIPPLPNAPTLPNLSIPPLPNAPPLPNLSVPPFKTPTLPPLNFPNTPPLPKLSFPPLSSFMFPPIPFFTPPPPSTKNQSP